MASRTSRTVRPHAASDRPTITKVGALPPSAYLHTPRTAWQEIVYQLSRHPGEWFQLARTYQRHHSPLQSARKAADEILKGDYSKRLECASEPAEDGHVTVYLRLAPEATGEADAEGDLAARFAEPDSLHHQLRDTDPEYADALDPEAAREAREAVEAVLDPEEARLTRVAAS